MWSKRNKYGAIKTKVDGILFHSKKEAERYIDLKYQEKQGLISNLELQWPFVLAVNDLKICKYVADFVYTRNRLTVVEDVKGVLTAVFKLKWKLLGILYPELTLEIYPPKKPRKPTSSSRQRQ
jgi:hypothetical protein